MSIKGRHIAGFFCGLGATLLIIKGNINEAMILLVGMLSYFIGEYNGQKKLNADVG